MNDGNKSKLPIKTVPLVIGVMIGSSIITAGATYFFTRDKAPASEATPAGVTTPAVLDNKLPDGTISPSDFLANIQNYSNADSKPRIRGLLIALENNQYILGEQQASEGQSSRAIKLEFSGTNIDPKPFINSYAGPEKAIKTPASGPVTVTIVSNSSSETTSFKVVSIEH